MKTSFFTLLTCSLVLGSVFGAELAPNVSEAKKKAKESKSDYLVFVYGGDWDKFGKLCKTKLWDKPETLSLVQEKTLATEYTCLENPTKEEQESRKELDKDMGERPGSLPTIFFFDRNGSCYASLPGAAMSKNPVLLAKQLKSTQVLREKRDEMIANAEKLSGPEKAKLLGEAGEIPGLNRPKDLLDQIKKCDPEDKSGYQKRFTFDPWKYHNLLEGPLDKGVTELDALIADSAYTVEQKQTLLGIKSTLLRKNKADKAQLKAVFEQMKKLGPDTVFGKSADKAIKEYAL